ncbi:MAG: hypothetical protein NZ522_05765 [Chitinophagales bacterium]|nr:hypothetical protein [Chitinophagales bacterium]
MNATRYSRAKFIAIFALQFFLIIPGAGQAIFKGKVCEDSAGRSPLFHATVYVLENGVEVLKLRSDFDGSFAFKTVPKSFYSIKTTYPGCKAISVEFETDKKGNPSRNNILFVMKRDGLRLVGRLLDAKTLLPIERAELVLRDIQTREETRHLTGKDGAYNLKLNYETNYRVSVDKRSPGILNRYQDTVFFISTIGFNQPLDYPLDIYLRPALQFTNRYEYYPLPDKPATKPIVEVGPTVQNNTVSKSGESFKDGKKIAESKEDKEQKTPTITKNNSNQSADSSKLKELSLKLDINRDKKAKNEKNDERDFGSTTDSIKKKTLKERKTESDKPLKDSTSVAAKKVREEIADSSKNPVNQSKTVTDNKLKPGKKITESEKVIKTIEANNETDKKNSRKFPSAIIYFAANTTFISQENKDKLKALAERLKNDSKLKLILHAHSGKDESVDHEFLCKTRLKAAQLFFMQNGVDAQRMELQVKGTERQIFECPHKEGCPEEKMLLNRRIEIYVE